MELNGKNQKSAGVGSAPSARFAQQQQKENAVTTTMVFGSATKKQEELIRNQMPFKTTLVRPKPNWNGDGKKAPTIRNQQAATNCRGGLVMVTNSSLPKFAYSVLKAFRNRGRRIFWFHNGRLTEVDGHPASKGYFSLPKEDAIPEPERWNAKEERPEFKAFDFERLRGMVRVFMIPKSAEEAEIPYATACLLAKLALDAIDRREAVEATIPARPWNYVMDADDLACSEEDALHPNNRE